MNIYMLQMAELGKGVCGGGGVSQSEHILLLLFSVYHPPSPFCLSQFPCFFIFLFFIVIIIFSFTFLSQFPCFFIFLFFYFLLLLLLLLLLFCFLAPHLQYMARLGVELDLQLPASQYHSHSNEGSELYLQPTPQLMAMLDP